MRDVSDDAKAMDELLLRAAQRRSGVLREIRSGQDGERARFPRISFALVQKNRRVLFPAAGERKSMTMSPRELLEQGVFHLVDERRIVSGIAVSYGDRTRGEAFCRGRIREVRLENGAFVPDEAPMDAEVRLRPRVGHKALYLHCRSSARGARQAAAFRPDWSAGQAFLPHRGRTD